MSHVSIPLIRGGRVSLPRALHGLWAGDKRHFRLRMDIYDHPGINKRRYTEKNTFPFFG